MRRVWLVALAALLLAAPLMPARPAADSRVGRGLFDAGHLPLFALVTWLVYHAVRARITERKARHVAVGLTCAAAAAGVELLQAQISGRTASVNDLLVGWAGVLLALAGIHVWCERSGRRWRLVHGAAALLAAVVVLGPAWTAWRATGWRHRQLPTIAGFEDALEMELWHPVGQGGSVRASTARAASGSRALEIDCGTDRYGGARYDAGYEDWSTYDHLALEVYNPQSALRLVVRIDETVEAGRFRRGFDLDPGWNTVRVDLRAPAEFDRRKVRHVLFYVPLEPDTRVSFVLDQIRLERD